MQAPFRSSTKRAAFTIIEVIVVVVILGVLASIIIPRLFSTDALHVEASARATGDLMSVAARRTALASQRIALDYSAETAHVRLLTFTAPTGGAPADSQWQVDSLMPAVEMGDTQIETISSDGVVLDPKGWRVEFSPGTHRPALEVVLTDRKGKEHWTIELGSLADHASVQSGGPRPQADLSIDLDATGAGSSPW